MFLVFAVVSCCIDRNPFAEALNAQPHGRLDVLMIACKTVIVFVFTMDTSFKAGALITTACLYGAVYLYGYMMLMPYYHRTVNYTHVALSFVYAWACVALVMLEIRRSPEVRAALCLRHCHKLIVSLVMGCLLLRQMSRHFCSSWAP